MSFETVSEARVSVPYRVSLSETLQPRNRWTNIDREFKPRYGLLCFSYILSSTYILLFFRVSETKFPRLESRRGRGTAEPFSR